MKNAIITILTLIAVLVISSCTTAKLNPPPGLDFDAFGAYLDSAIPDLLSENLPGIQILSSPGL